MHAQDDVKLHIFFALDAVHIKNISSHKTDCSIGVTMFRKMVSYYV